MTCGDRCVKNMKANDSFRHKSYANRETYAFAERSAFTGMLTCHETQSPSHRKAERIDLLLTCGNPLNCTRSFSISVDRRMTR